ncbi:hypothetical protein SAMN05192541_1082 [Bradyrhizobium arachidis]|nr:hypothetical protein SAMN05192541_1082 [Bradyrhizobium arachidis]
MQQGTRYGTTTHSRKVVQDSDAYTTTAGRLFKSGFERSVHGNKTAVAESGAWCNDLEGRCHTGELR